MTPAQLQMVRTLLGWSRDRLAGRSNVPVNAVLDYERVGRPASDAYQAAIRAALEEAGVEFANFGQPDVKLREPGQ